MCLDTTLYSIIGHKVAEIIVEPNTESFYWSPKQLGSGTYFLVTEPNHQIIAKFHWLGN